MFYSCEKSISGKNPVIPIEKFSSLILPRNAILQQQLVIQFSLYYLSSGRLPPGGYKQKKISNF